MLELIGITLAITLGCNVLAGIGSYVTLYTDLFAGQRLQTRSYRADTFWKRLPLIAFNLTILTDIDGCWSRNGIHGIRLWMARWGVGSRTVSLFSIP